MILVAGGTGRLGDLVVRKLRAAGLPVRVLTRDPARADHLHALGVEVAVGDVRRPATIEEAARGVTTVVSAIHGFAAREGGSPAGIDREGNAALVRAATRVRADVVMMSVLGVAHDHPLALFRMKAAAEDDLRVQPVAWTIVRAAAFAELHLEILRRTAGRAKAPVVLGHGDNPVNVVSVEDVADAVIEAVAGRFRACVVDIGGPEDLTFDELARIVQRRLRRPEQPIRHVPRRLLRALSRAQELPRVSIGQIAASALVLDTRPMTYDALHHPDAIPRRGTRTVDTLAGEVATSV